MKQTLLVTIKLDLDVKCYNQSFIKSYLDSFFKDFTLTIGSNTEEVAIESVEAIGYEYDDEKEEEEKKEDNKTKVYADEDDWRNYGSEY